jgi:hypothetical protein
MLTVILSGQAAQEALGISLGPEPEFDAVDGGTAIPAAYTPQFVIRQPGFIRICEEKHDIG